MNCVSCGGAMRLEAAKECLVCNYCGNIVFPGPNQDGVRMFGELSETSCPVCRVALFEAVLAGHRILCCERCRGMLVSIDDFLQIVAQRRAALGGLSEPARPLDWGDIKRRLVCPRCGEPMDTHPYGGPGSIIIDNCPHCRVNWLDHKELERIVRAADRTPPSEWSEPVASQAAPGSVSRGAFFEEQPPQGAQVVEEAAADGRVLGKILQFVRNKL